MVIFISMDVMLVKDADAERDKQIQTARELRDRQTDAATKARDELYH